MGALASVASQRQVRFIRASWAGSASTMLACHCWTLSIAPGAGTSDVDMVDTALQVGLNLIPVVSGTSAAAAMVTKQVVKQRTEKFFHLVVDKLEELGIQVEDLEDLQETFASRIQQGILAAQHTHQQDKLEARRNGVVNCLLPTAPEETFQQIFLSLVDELSDLHLRLVVFLVEPTRFGMDPNAMHYLHGVNPRNPSATQDILERNVTPGVRRDLRNLCFEDLVRRGLAEYSTGTEQFGGAVIRTSAPKVFYTQGSSTIGYSAEQ